MYTKKLHIVVIASCLFMMLPTHARAAKGNPQETSREKAFILDRYMSPYASSPLIMSTRALLSEGEDYLFPPREPSSLLGRYARSVGNNFVNDVFMLISHEANGHGFRARRLGFGVRGYSGFLLLHGALGFITPANSLGGATHYASAPKTTEEDLLGVIAGNEANSVLAQQVILKDFATGTLDYRMYNLFFKAFTNLLGYIVLTSDAGVAGMGEGIAGDITEYQKLINKKHGKQGMPLSALRWGSVSFFLNPVLYVSIWSFYAHIFGGQRDFSIPRLELGSVHYMPLIRMGLTPFGIAYYLENYIAYGGRSLLVSFNAGGSSFYSHPYGGVQVQTEKLWNYSRYSLDLEGHLWHQPKLLLADNAQLEDKNYLGGLIGINNTFKISQYFSLNADVSYKTPGFVEGVVADSGFNFRGGFTLHY